MRFAVTILFAIIFCAACHPTSREGSSEERAIRLHATDQEAGIRAEHDWIQKNLPGAHLADAPKAEKTADGDEVVYFAHRTTVSEKRIFSVYTLQLPDGSVRDVFFDQSEYFGKEKKEPNQ